MSKKVLIPIIIIAIIIVFAVVMRLTSQPVTEPNVTKKDITQEETKTEPKEEKTLYKDVTPEEAQKLIQDNPEILIIDVSPRYAEGHLLNSVNYYVGDGSLDQVIPILDKERTYLVYCHVDSASILGAQKLVQAGFTKVFRLAGNYVGWTEAGNPVIADISSVEEVLEASLKDVSDGEGSGTGYVERNENSLKHLVRAALSKPEGENFYEGWLVKQEPKPEFFSTGRMTETPEGNWLLEYVTDEEQIGFDQVVITLETVADETPEIHILEGTVK